MRVGLSQASEAMMIAIWFTVRLPFNDTAMMISTSNCGTVRPISAMLRMTVSTQPR